MAYENITAEKDGAVGVITLNRPKALNALNSALIAELGDGGLLHIGELPDHVSQFIGAIGELLQRHRHIEFVNQAERTERLRLPLAVLPEPFDFAGVKTNDDVPILKHRRNKAVSFATIGHLEQRE